MDEIIILLFHILYTIAINTANTLIVIAQDVAKIVRIASASSPFFISGLLLALILIGFWYFTKSSIKTILIAAVLLFLLLLLLVFS